MTELTDFLLARIAEDEAVARAAISATGDDQWGTHTYRVVASGEFEVADASVPTATHIARHDPARVLADCAAKREVVRIVGRLGGHYEPDAGRQAPGILRALANIYAGADGFQEAWRV